MVWSTFNASFADNLGTEIIDVYVGPEQSHYVVHKNLLTTQSEYFNKALTGSFMEAEENSIHLKEEDPAAVSLLIGWLYRGANPVIENFTPPFVRPMLSPEPVKIPVSEQGTIFTFAPTQIPASYHSGLFGGSGSASETLQHICQQSTYAIFSPEELRLSDYKLNRKYQGDVPTANIAPLVAPPPAPPSTGSLLSNSSSQVSSHGAGSSLLGSLASQAFSGHSESAAGQSYAGLFAQPNTTQRQNMFARLHNPTLPITISSVSGTQNPLASLNNSTSRPSNNNAFGGLGVPPNQSSNLFVGLNNLAPRPPNSNIFGNLEGPAPTPNQTTNIFAHLSNSISSPTSSNPCSALVPAANQSRTPFGQLSAQAPTYLDFRKSLPTAGIFNGAVLQTSNPTQIASTDVSNSNWQAPPISQCTGRRLSSFGSVPTTNQIQNVPGNLDISNSQASSSTGGGIFGGPLGNPRPDPSTQSSFPFTGSVAPPNHQVNLGGLGFRNHFSIYDPGAVLPSGAKLVTSVPQEPKTQKDFGYYPAIKYMKSPGQFIDGISRSDPTDEQFIDLEKQQLALLNLCIMAETMCWSALFNEAINAYIRGEHKLQRPITVDFIDRIYTRTYPESTLRAYVLDSISHLKKEGVEDISPYMAMAHKHDDFLANLLDKIIGSSDPPNEVTDETVENYLMFGMDDDLQ